MQSAVAFRPEFLDFQRGIRVGNLEENERITRLLKAALEERYSQPFVTERWGRGVYWRWIGFLVRANREAKPMSSHVSFGCSKFFVMMDTGEPLGRLSAFLRNDGARCQRFERAGPDRLDAGGVRRSHPRDEPMHPDHADGGRMNLRFHFPQ